MASKQAAAGEALAAQINGMSRSEMYDMMSKMKVRPPHAYPNPQTLPQPCSSLSLHPPFVHRFTHRLLMFLCYICGACPSQTMIDHDQETVRRMLVDNPDVTRALFRVRFPAV